jgi:hypothetical protein
VRIRTRWTCLASLKVCCSVPETPPTRYSDGQGCCFGAAPWERRDHPLAFGLTWRSEGLPTARVPCTGSPFERPDLVVDRSTAGSYSGDPGVRSLDGGAVQNTGLNSLDQFKHLARVLVCQRPD